MALTRRGFLGLLATGAVATCVVAKIPTGWLPEAVRTYAACEYLRSAWLNYAKTFGMAPERMYAGRALYEGYESELSANMRFTSARVQERHLMFKGSPLFERGAGWQVQCLGSEAV